MTKIDRRDLLVGLGALVLGLIGGVLVSGKIGCDRGDWIPLCECLGIWFTGGLGAWFVFHQNEILNNQNSIMERQLDHDKMVESIAEGRNRVDSIRAVAKGKFRRARDRRGLLQYAGDDLRRQYPENKRAILEAYRELVDEEPDLRLPRFSEFLEMMRMYNRSVDWPNLD